MEFRLEEICRLINGLLEGDGGIMVRGVNTLETASAEEIAYAESDRYFDLATAGEAAAIVVDKDFPEIPGRNLLRVTNPKLMFVRVMEMFVPPSPASGMHPDAFIADGANMAAGVSVGACAVISNGVMIGARTVIEPGVYVGPGVTIGEDCYIEANAVLMKDIRLGDRVIIHAGSTIGGDGFGYIWQDDHHHKIPQLGTVQIEDDVEIGCNSCIDRATMGATRIGRGTKIDNQVHIAHNNNIGEHVILAGQVGTAGSVTVEAGAVFGGQAGIADHIKVGAGAQVGGATSVTCDIKPGEKVWGMPSRPFRRVLKEQAYLGRLPEMAKQLKLQEQELNSLQARLIELERMLPSRP
ncbi:UDP-3-O-[3-hydroxymyristoyl] glucosamine N-acyltransferase [hydrothermal vent metagenome]|uniref:UDP-3-O-[3-hydroxymyristoyl] glucosamine N-acyltransferase n=1 Tax=hydrothermal vent metagenome TaxID=652676 RepID=A0A3B1C1U2_9ZZZZ